MKKTTTPVAFSTIFLALALTLFSACETPADPEGPAAATVAPATSENVYDKVDQYPSLLDQQAFYADIEYPEVAKKAGIEGKVFVEFIVDEEGNVSDASVKKGIGAGCDEEALRALTATRFQPGIKDGKPVKVKMVMPFTFKLPQS